MTSEAPDSGRTRSSSATERLAAVLAGGFGPETDWELTIATANEHLLSPYLYQRLRDAGPDAAVDPEAMDYLESLNAANIERNLRLTEQLAEVAAAANALDIRPIVIKGAAHMVRAATPGEFPRIIHDLDLLVDADRVSDLDKAFRSLGYVSETDTPESHSVANYARPDAVGLIDLHVRLPQRFGSVVTEADFKDRTVAVDVGGARILVPDPALQIVICLVHDTMHNLTLLSGLTDFAYVVELVELSEQWQNEIDWDWIDRKRANRYFDLALELQQRMARHLLGAAPFPRNRTTVLGAALHRRRLISMRHPRLRAIDLFLFRGWLKAVKRLRRRR